MTAVTNKYNDRADKIIAERLALKDGQGTLKSIADDFSMLEFAYNEAGLPVKISSFRTDHKDVSSLVVRVSGFSHVEGQRDSVALTVTALVGESRVPWQRSSPTMYKISYEAPKEYEPDRGTGSGTVSGTGIDIVMEQFTNQIDKAFNVSDAQVIAIARTIQAWDEEKRNARLRNMTQMRTPYV